MTLVFCAAGMLLGGCVREELKTIDVFYTADAEGFYWSRPEPRLENREAGGYAVLKSFLDKQEPGFLLFDGGNWFGSAPEGSMTKGAYVAELAGTLPYTAASVSDKDFAYGWPSLRSVVRELPYPFVVSNLTLENKIPWPMHDYQIRTVDGIKIGIFALVGASAINKNKSRLPGFRAQDPVESAQKMVSLLKEKGVDYIILLSSLGDSGAVGDAELAAEAGGINLILSANKDLENAETDQVGETFIVYPGAKLDGVAHVRLSFDKKTNQFRGVSFKDVALLKESFGEDVQIASRAQTLLNETRKKMNARVTDLPHALETSLSRESELGSQLALCLHRWAKLDGAVINSDSIRAPLPAGRVSEYDLYKTYPYGDNITFLTMRGDALLRALEASLNEKDNFPQAAGLTVTYNPTAPAGQKIKQVVLEKNGRVVRPRETYRIAVTDHVLAGGLGHDKFIDSLEFKNTFVEARQIMRSCLARQKELPAKTQHWKPVE
ncbi:MAG: 5'-nucleotidase C-terminal domain-containing protein [Elusimicrobiales bacterium]|nr:5'-nucleotidase C-terminal domain-containing protein [Elusimicrobiales bacterium]